MAQSPEYPDLRWMPPAAFGTGRDGKAVRYIVIHYTAGAERNTSAEEGAVIDQNRTDGTSTHYFVDSDSVVQCVLTKNRANAARTKGNRLGIQYELCGTVQTRAQWLDAASLPTLRNAARQVARDCRKYGIPVRRLSVAETRAAWYDFPAGPQGIVGHVDCTYAYPEDGGDHTDPGTQFPWDVFLDMVRAELEGDMTPEETQAACRAAIMDVLFDGQAAALGKASGDTPDDRAKRNVRDTIRAIVGGPVDQGAILGAVGQVDDEVWAKLADRTTPDEQIAAALITVLGDRAPTVVPLLQTYVA